MQAEEKQADYKCPNCGTAVAPNTPQCPNCHGLFKAAQDTPFDSRTEVSADARHIAGRIVKHMWIIAVLLPVIIGLAWALLRSVER
jgi:predicted ATP-dependent serine protease